MFSDPVKKEKFRTFLLEEVCKLRRGKAFLSNKYRDSGSPIIRVRNVQKHQITTDSLVYFSSYDYEEDLSKYILKPKDLAVTLTGKAMVFLNQLDDSFYMGSDICRLDPDLEVLDREYFFHFLSNLNLDLIVKSGMIPHLDLSKFKKLEIHVPSLSLQKEIASKLGKIQELKEELRMRKRQGVYYRNKIMQSLQERALPEE
ncbi:type I restriction enzyme specificity HsdS domain protein [Mycoplasma haemocanis str. Illinois]|uniref:Type I restriction enzyme specificity HsdS domain protein n=1 Tax=Mycoplasma haemocanis (strain Illinois) TaxID=1111676 RepID=H6N6Z3_MYCHN|nr:restriction endonuclease subunit S [Mycoplasma haemocanis]AEW45415.1 type I restriction enzyme specificity HsdS domain protein [Mycoplasma haemocanis str. Illinois]